jgi:hypothetical protein
MAISAELLLLGTQYLQEQLASNLTYVQSHPQDIVLALMSLASNPSPTLSLTEEAGDWATWREYAPSNLYLRGLGNTTASTSDPTFVTNLVLTVLCVIMAGFASGLTQV